MYLILVESLCLPPTNREIRPLVTDGLAEFKKYPVQVHNFREVADRFEGVYRIYLALIKKNRKISTWEQLLDLLETPISQLILPKMSLDTVWHLVIRNSKISRASQLHNHWLIKLDTSVLCTKYNLHIWFMWIVMSTYIVFRVLFTSFLFFSSHHCVK